MRTAIIVILALLFALPTTAEVPSGAENNAALRYWNAFAQMSDATITEAQSRQLEAIANGTSAWDESAFGKLLDDNAQAVETMVRGTSFPYCAWGLDLQLGADNAYPADPTRARACPVKCADRAAARRSGQQPGSDRASACWYPLCAGPITRYVFDRCTDGQTSIRFRLECSSGPRSIQPAFQERSRETCSGGSSFTA